MGILLWIKAAIVAKYYDVLQAHQATAVGVCSLTITIMIAGFLILKVYLKDDKPQSKLPPGSLGLPFLGETLQFLWALKSNKPEEFFDERVKKFGHVFKTSLLSDPTVVVTGPSGNRLLLSNENKLVVGAFPNSFLRLIGIDSLMSRSGGEYRVLRAALMTFFSPEALQNHVRKLSLKMEQHLIEKWKVRQEINVLSMVRQLNIYSICSLFFSLEDEHIQEQLLDIFEVLVLGSMSVPLDFPGTRYRRALYAKKKLNIILSPIVQERRKHLQQGSASSDKDLLSVLLTVKDGKGNLLTDKEIVDNISMLIHGGLDSTTSTITLTLKLLSSNKGCYDQIVKEQMQILSSKKEGEVVTWQDTKKMQYTWQVVQETLRMFPVGFGTFRRAIVDIEYNGYTIPKGWKLLWSVHSTHRKEAYFKDPDEFRPSRFEVEEAVAPYTFLPFGGGTRICVGWEFAKLEVQLFMHYFVKTFSDYVAIDPDENITMDPLLPLPVNGFPIKLFPRS
uniref:CYP450 725 family protein n=1 Tax=Ginkgo biloba TaxID=3311 RepID=W0G3W2_GINBI|nr:CYP450 725 family protein [Ginkgo biloba]UTS77790.1 cytochrome P450 725A8 [Ginkgo biloba]